MLLCLWHLARLSECAVLDTAAGVWCDRRGTVLAARTGKFSADAPGGGLNGSSQGAAGTLRWRHWGDDLHLRRPQRG